MSHTQDEELQGIAIIGMSGRFPGAKNTEELWANLRDGIESVEFFTKEELIAAGVDPETLNDPNFVPAGAVLKNAEDFDAAFFGYIPREAEVTDPQQRLFLECAWESLESAGYDPQTYDGRVGVFGGVGHNSYLTHLYAHPDHVKAVGQYQALIGNGPDFLATRVSYKLNLKGPSMTVQTACSTSLVAVHLACQSLLTYECDMAMAGGVSVRTTQRQGYLYEEGAIFSPDGHCRAFDEKAKGTIVGNGVGVIVLKRLEDAVQDGDHIYAVIKGSAINNDGSNKAGFTAPSVDDQARVILDAMAIADVEPESISYVEAHGTGTPIGDPIEITALTEAYRQSTDLENYCAIGSLKTNIGHLDTAAGVSGVIKTALALQNRLLPPSLHFEKPNPKIDFANSPFYVNNTLQEWKSEGPRRAGVSSFGIGGTNAHAILEEAPEVEASAPAKDWQLLVLSAKTPTALDTATANLKAHLEQRPDLNLADVAFTLQVGRQPFKHRRIFAVRDHADAVNLLGMNDSKRVLSAVFDQEKTSERPVMFMFTGTGSQYVNMARDLYEGESVFRDHIDRCSLLLKPHLGLDLRDLIYPPGEVTEEQVRLLNQTSYAQPALFVIEYALAQLLVEWGIQPKAMIGHSLGEYVAACLAGVFTLENALALVAKRAHLIQGLPDGAMLVVSLPEADVLPLLGADLSLAVVNTAAQCVVAGTLDAVERFEQELKERGVDCARVHTVSAFHSHLVEGIMDEFAKLVASFGPQAPELPFVSNVTGTWITEEQATDPQYWARHLRQTVRFAEGVRTLGADSNSVLLEVGPGKTLSSFAMQAKWEDGAARTVSTSIRHIKDSQHDREFLLHTVGKLWLFGVKIDWKQLHGGERRLRLPLPTYPFERKRYYLEAPNFKWTGAGSAPARSQQEEEQQQETPAVALSGHARPNLLTAYVAPTTETEEVIAQFVSELLGIEEVGIQDNFFDLGANSLLATQLISRVRNAFGIELTAKTFFEASNVEDLAMVVEEILIEQITGASVAEIASTESE